MSTFSLKILACITMLIDHITAAFVPVSSVIGGGSDLSFYMIGRLIGRIAFPIYCFLLVEGFYYTSSRRKYILRMFLFALISEIPFDMAFNGFPKERFQDYMSYQNVMFTLFLGLVLMYFYEDIKMRYLAQPVIFNTLGVLLILGTSMTSVLLKSDYQYTGILFVLVFYLFRGKKAWIAAGLAAVIVLFSNRFEIFALAALVPIFLYNKEPGRKVKYLFYAFYPVHLLILGMILLVK